MDTTEKRVGRPMGSGKYVAAHQSIRFGDAEVKTITARTESTGETVSAYVRRLVREDGGKSDDGSE